MYTHLYFPPYGYYNPYAVLGVSETAELTEIKKVYRQLAKTLHPDLNPDDIHAIPRFQELNRAYEAILALRTNPFPSYPHASPSYPHHSSYGTSQSNQAKPPAQDFQAYSWDTMAVFTEEDLYYSPPTMPSSSPEEMEEKVPEERIEEIPVETVPWREDMLKVAYEESFREAKARALKKKFSVEEQLSQDIMIYLMRGQKKKRF